MRYLYEQCTVCELLAEIFSSSSINNSWHHLLIVNPTFFTICTTFRYIDSLLLYQYIQRQAKNWSYTVRLRGSACVVTKVRKHVNISVHTDMKFSYCWQTARRIVQHAMAWLTPKTWTSPYRKFPHPRVSKAPAEGVPHGIGWHRMATRNQNDGTDWPRKSMLIPLAVLIRYTNVSDRRTYRHRTMASTGLASRDKNTSATAVPVNTSGEPWWVNMNVRNGHTVGALTLTRTCRLCSGRVLNSLQTTESWTLLDYQWRRRRISARDSKDWKVKLKSAVRV